MKNFFIAALLCAVLIISSLSPIYATDRCDFETAPETEEEHYRVETLITDIPDNLPSDSADDALNDSTRACTKTACVTNTDGEILWYVTITAVFSYNGKSAECVSSSYKAVSQEGHWEIKSSSNSKRGNSTTVCVTAARTGALGISREYTHNVKLQCSPTGIIF